METFFFGRHEGKLETFAKNCVAASLETLCKDPAVRVRENYSAKSLEPPLSKMYSIFGVSFLI